MSKIAVIKYTKKETLYRIIPAEEIKFEWSIMASCAEEIAKDIDTEILSKLTSKNP